MERRTFLAGTGIGIGSCAAVDMGPTSKDATAATVVHRAR